MFKLSWIKMNECIGLGGKIEVDRILGLEGGRGGMDGDGGWKGRNSIIYISL